MITIISDFKTEVNNRFHQMVVGGGVDSVAASVAHKVLPSVKFFDLDKITDILFYEKEFMKRFRSG